MKKMKKVLAMLTALVMILGMSTAVSAAVNITVTRDSTTYEEGGTTESGNRTYTYKLIFRATENENHTSTGGGYDADGTPGSVTTGPDKGISYYLDATEDAARIEKLGSWDTTNNQWTKASGNLWFKLTKSADGTRYAVEWENTDNDADTVQAAARWLDANYPAITSDNLTAAEDGKSWTASDLPEGYYLLKGDTGENLIAATTDITVNEKNSYPTVDKKQKDAEDGTYADVAVNVKIGDTIYYQVEVKVPADANADIVVADTMPAGLTYNTATDPVVKVGDTALTVDAAEEQDYAVGTKTAQGWTVTIHPTEATKGQTVVITYVATVNNTALTTIQRDNKVKITYGNYKQEDVVEHELGAAAVIKFDGATAKIGADHTLTTSGTIKYLEATFTLKDGNGNAVKVKEATAGTKGVYVVDTTATSNSVTSDKAHNGVILIYGLDPDVTYTLTETATEAGYNLMSGTTPVTVVAAVNGTDNATKITVAEAAGVSAGDASADSANTLELTAANVGKIANNQGSVLPATGGIGTTIFYIVGAILVIGAGVVLVTRRRMDTK